VKSLSSIQHVLRRVVPPIAGVILIVLFTKLGLWQLDRAKLKHEMLDAFKNPASYAEVSRTLEPQLYRAIMATGQYHADTQILITNIVRDGRLGYYVISPLDYATGSPLLLVNRGWVEKKPGQQGLPEIALDPSVVTVRGKSGKLPQVGIRSAAVFADRNTWPRIGVWPTSEEVSAELGRDVHPYVLLLDADQPSGFVRHWEPQHAPPSTHYGYALQWFGMATIVFAIGVWQIRKRRSGKSDV
jgi:surfeit locus 1 family protein